MLKNPANGTVMQDKVFATYACLPHHGLKGSKIRICNTENGTWQNEEPTCSAGELVYKTSIISIKSQFGKQTNQGYFRCIQQIHNPRDGNQMLFPRQR